MPDKRFYYNYYYKSKKKTNNKLWFHSYFHSHWLPNDFFLSKRIYFYCDDDVYARVYLFELLNCRHLAFKQRFTLIASLCQRIFELNFKDSWLVLKFCWQCRCIVCIWKRKSRLVLSTSGYGYYHFECTKLMRFNSWLCLFIAIFS